MRQSSGNPVCVGGGLEPPRWFEHASSWLPAGSWPAQNLMQFPSKGDFVTKWLGVGGGGVGGLGHLELVPEVTLPPLQTCEEYRTSGAPVNHTVTYVSLPVIAPSQM